jgi:ubiquitin-like protein 4
MAKKIKTAAAPGSSKSVKVQLKSARNPVLEISLDNVPLTTTTIHDLRETVRQRVLAADGKEPPAADKIKILYKKKPVGGSTERTIAEILTDSEPEVLAGGKTVEFGIMILGGASVRPEVTESPAGAGATVAEPEPFPSKPAQGPSGSEVLQTEAFWKDLEGFLEIRTKDTVEALRLTGVFKRAWQADAAQSSS